MIETFAEFLFYLTGGTKLVLSLWIIPYTVILVLLIAIAVGFGIYYVESKGPIIGFISLPVVIFIFVVGMGTPLYQPNMLVEGNCIQHEISTLNDNTTTITECLVKDNYYDQNRKWEIVNR